MNNTDKKQSTVDYPALYAEMQELQGWNWWFKVHYPAILDLLEEYLKPGMLVLDLGSAGGWSTANLPVDVRRTMLDIRPAALTLSGRRPCAGVCGDAHYIPLRDGRFDVIICEGLLHQCEATDPRRIIEEAVRVCRPGGIIVSVEPAFNCLFGSHDLVFGGCRRYTTRSLLNLFSGLPVSCRKKTYLHLFVFIPAWLVRTFSKRSTTDLSLGNRLTNTICIWLGTVERWFNRLFPMPFGVTAAVLMHREPDRDENSYRRTDSQSATARAISREGATPLR